MAALDPVTGAEELIKEVGGKLIDHFLPSAEAAAAAKAKLVELEQSGALAKMAAESEVIRAYLADTQSARNREAQIATSASAPTINKVITPLLAIGIIGLTFVLCGVMIWLADGELKPAQERVIFFVVGALVPICSQVVSYYFGSSRGDAANAQHLRDLINKNGS